MLKTIANIRYSIIYSLFEKFKISIIIFELKFTNYKLKF